MATTPSWLSCLKPHVSWVFGQLRHFNFSGPGATAFVLSQEGDIRPPFFEVWEGGGFAPAPLVDRRAPPYNPQLLKKLAKLLLVSTQLAWRDPPLRNARRRLVLSGHGP